MTSTPKTQKTIQNILKTKSNSFWKLLYNSPYSSVRTRNNWKNQLSYLCQILCNFLGQFITHILFLDFWLQRSNFTSKDKTDLVKFVMCFLVSRVHMTFYILTKGNTVPANQGTRDKLNQISLLAIVNKKDKLQNWLLFKEGQHLYL